MFHSSQVACKMNLLIQIALSLLVVFRSASFIYAKGIKSVISKNLIIFTLIASDIGDAAICQTNLQRPQSEANNVQEYCLWHYS